jgi:hypothetical protein
MNWDAHLCVHWLDLLRHEAISTVAWEPVKIECWIKLESCKMTDTIVQDSESRLNSCKKCFRVKTANAESAESSQNRLRLTTTTVVVRDGHRAGNVFVGFFVIRATQEWARLKFCSLLSRLRSRGLTKGAILKRCHSGVGLSQDVRLNHAQPAIRTIQRTPMSTLRVTNSAEHVVVSARRTDALTPLRTNEQTLVGVRAR